MNLSELIDAVAIRTKRPDRAEEILLAIQEATLFCHRFDFFKRDMVEIPINHVSVSAPSGLSFGQLVVDSVLPSFRKIAYWNKHDPVSNLPYGQLLPIEPDALFDTYSRLKTDKYYLGGRSLNWRSCSVDKLHIIGYWRFPDVSKSRYQSWIADNEPFCIINQASAEIFRLVGQQDEAKICRGRASEELMVVQANDIETSGR